MPNLATITDRMLAVSDETFESALAASISAGATTVPINSLAIYDEGDEVVLTVDPGTASQATVKGEVDGNSLINCVWTEGNVEVGHDTGAAVIDYDSATHYNLLVKLLKQFANDDGTLKQTAVQQSLNISGSVNPDWTPLATVPTVQSSNGQKEHVLRYASVDYSDRLQAGTKLKLPRTGTTPTTSMSFVAASSQYASKAAPTGLTFTDDFTCEAWVYLDSYPGTDGTIISRHDAGDTNGWFFDISSTGVVRILGRNAGADNFRLVQTYQSIPLKKWTHVSATLDMSGYTTATNKIHIDGVEVPVSLSSFGTNPTSLVNTGDLAIGRRGAKTSNYIGAQFVNIRVWSTIRTAAQIRDNMNQETPASTTGLVAHFKGNGSWNDSSANANHLTAVNGAVNNFASHPYSATEYAVATKVEYTGGNTDVTVFTGSGSLPNETLAATSYSTARAPYGFPVDKEEWSLWSYFAQDVSSGIGSAAAMYNLYPGLSIVAPVGSWRLVEQTSVEATGTGATTNVLRTCVTTEEVALNTAYSNAGLFLKEMTTRWAAHATNTLAVEVKAETKVKPTTPTKYSTGFRMEAAAGAFSMRHVGSSGDMISFLKLECAYL